MSKQNEYEIEIEIDGGVEYVVVKCPKGHRLRGMQTGDIEARLTVACTVCKATWTVLAPLTNGMEAIP